LTVCATDNHWQIFKLSLPSNSCAYQTEQQHKVQQNEAKRETFNLVEREAL